MIYFAFSTELSLFPGNDPMEQVLLLGHLTDEETEACRKLNSVSKFRQPGNLAAETKLLATGPPTLA